MRMTNPNFVIASLKCYLIDGGAVAKWENETRHTKLVRPSCCALPLPACGEREG